MKRVAAGLLLVLAWVAPSVAQAPPEPTSPPPPAAPAESPGQAMLEAEELALSGRVYAYDPAGRRDPFRSLLTVKDRAAGERPAGIAGISIDDIILQGIWKTGSGQIAQIRGVDNRSYLLRAGDLLYDGEVVRVGPNEVTFRQNLNDPQSVKPFRDVTKQLNVTVRQ